MNCIWPSEEFPNLIKINQPGDPFPIAHFLPEKQYLPWQGFAFEKVCFQHNRLIAEKLGFGAVRYDAGSWFKRGLQNTKIQIDLIYARADGVLTLCEIKFTKNKIGKEVIKDIEKKVETLPNPTQLTVEKVLITAVEPTKPLLNEEFLMVFSLLKIFSAHDCIVIYSGNRFVSYFVR